MDLKRNDVEGALQVWQQAQRQEGDLGALWSVLLQLQDDPAKLQARLEEKQVKTATGRRVVR